MSSFLIEGRRPILYIASSWQKTHHHENIVAALRSLGFEVFNYREIEVVGCHKGFSWSDIDAELTKVRGLWRKMALQDPLAMKAFNLDRVGMDACDGLVLLLPSGKNAHIEFGYVRGQGKPCWVFYEDEFNGGALGSEPELLYQFAYGCFTKLQDLKESLQTYPWGDETRRRAETLGGQATLFKMRYSAYQDRCAAMNATVEEKVQDAPMEEATANPLPKKGIAENKGRRPS